MRSAAWDVRLAIRAAALAAVATAVTLLVIAATDEGARWAARLGMAAALSPVMGSLGVVGALRIAAARGELRALAAIGVSPARASLGAVGAGASAGLVGAAIAASPLADLGGLFPRPLEARSWIAVDGGLREVTLGLAIDARGALSLVEAGPAGASGLPAGARAFALLALALGALAGPAWIAAPRGPLRRGLVGVAALAAAIVAFQSVAAGRLPPVVLIAAPIIVLIDRLIER